jgi:hypothetical protein
MLDTAANLETISCASVERDFADGNSQMSTHEIDHLLVGMTVESAGPFFSMTCSARKSVSLYTPTRRTRRGSGELAIVFADWTKTESGCVLFVMSLNELRTIVKTIDQPLLIRFHAFQVRCKNLDNRKSYKISGAAHHKQRRVVAVRPFQHVSD